MVWQRRTAQARFQGGLGAKIPGQRVSSFVLVWSFPEAERPAIRPHPAMKSQLLAVLVTLSSALWAQVQEGPPKPRQGERTGQVEEVQAITSGDSEIEILPDGARIIRTIGDNGEIVEKHIPPQDPSQMGMPQMAPDEMARHGGGFFEASVMVRPPRLAPGESGELYVYVTLRGFAVVVPGARVEAEYKKVQGPLVLGSDDLMPAKPGTRKTRFKGKPVYDDSLTFKIPITISPDAKHGTAQFEGSVLLEVTHGDTGDVLGRFRAVAPGRVEIGRPFPRPVPQGAGRRPAGSNPKPAPGSKTAGTGTDPVAAGSKRPGGKGGAKAKATGEGHLNQGEGPSTEEPNSSALSEDVGEASDTMDLAFWGIGGLLVVLLVLVLRRR